MPDISVKLRASRPIFINIPSTKFHVNPSSGSRADKCGQMDWHNTHEHTKRHFARICEFVWYPTLSQTWIRIRTKTSFLKKQKPVFVVIISFSHQTPSTSWKSSYLRHTSTANHHHTRDPNACNTNLHVSNKHFGIRHYTPGHVDDQIRNKGSFHFSPHTS
jgi:hypothetical protein